jgi:hypothetical protein
LAPKIKQSLNEPLALQTAAVGLAASLFGFGSSLASPAPSPSVEVDAAWLLVDALLRRERTSRRGFNHTVWASPHHVQVS